jgi:hypothetical protein
MVYDFIIYVDYDGKVKSESVPRKRNPRKSKPKKQAP